MKKSMVLIIVAAIIIIIIGIIVGYLYYSGFFNHRQGRFPEGNLQLNQSQIDDVTSFFNSNPTQEDINIYCQQNRMNCFYYCRNINKDSDLCKDIMNQSRTGMRNNTYGPGDNSGMPNGQGGMPPPQPPQ